MREIGAYSLPLLAGLAVCGFLILRRAVRLAPLRWPKSIRFPQATRGARVGFPTLRRVLRAPRAGNGFETLPRHFRVRLWCEERRQRPGEQRN